MYNPTQQIRANRAVALQMVREKQQENEVAQINADMAVTEEEKKQTQISSATKANEAREESQPKLIGTGKGGLRNGGDKASGSEMPGISDLSKKIKKDKKKKLAAAE